MPTPTPVFLAYDPHRSTGRVVDRGRRPRCPETREVLGFRYGPRAWTKPGSALAVCPGGLEPVPYLASAPPGSIGQEAGGPAPGSSGPQPTQSASTSDGGCSPNRLAVTNRYRTYSEHDTSRRRLLIGRRQLDLPLDRAAEIASLCADGRCDEVSAELATALPAKRTELAVRIEAMVYLDRHLAHLSRQLEAGDSLRSPISSGKEERHADEM